MRNKSGAYFLLNVLISRRLKMKGLLRKPVVCARGLSGFAGNTDFGIYPAAIRRCCFAKVIAAVKSTLIDLNLCKSAFSNVKGL